jgi:TetR/AcrR family transcriptional repressor of nem operon
MRYSTEHKQHTRERILAAASRRFKAQGFDGTGVAAIMNDADLTHGGFYAHFASKDALVAEVIRTGFDGVSARFEARFDHLEGDDWLRAWVNEYLSLTHAQLTAEGCPLPSLAGEIARSGPDATAAFTGSFLTRLDRVGAHIDAPKPEAERRVLAAISQMAGAMMLARATDEPLSARILDAARAEAIRTLTGEGDPAAPQSEASTR